MINKIQKQEVVTSGGKGKPGKHQKTHGLVGQEAKQKKSLFSVSDVCGGMRLVNPEEEREVREARLGATFKKLIDMNENYLIDKGRSLLSQSRCPMCPPPPSTVTRCHQKQASPSISSTMATPVEARASLKEQSGSMRPSSTAEARSSTLPSLAMSPPITYLSYNSDGFRKETFRVVSDQQ